MSDKYGPFDVHAGIVQRAPHFIDLIIRDRPGTAAYRLRGAGSLDDAYGTLAGSGVAGTGPVLILEAQKDQIARSPLVIRRGAGMVEESRKGQTSFQFDMDDAPFGGGGSIGAISDDDSLFVRIQERRTTSGWLVSTGPLNVGVPVEGPILFVPSPTFFGMGAPAFTLYGTAPDGTTCAPGIPPIFDETLQIPPPMHIVFPRPAYEIRVQNLDPVLSMLVSTGVGMPMTEVTHTDGVTLFRGPGIHEVLLSGTSGSLGGGPVKFSLSGTIALASNI